jgi:hypothetical protein
LVGTALHFFVGKYNPVPKGSVTGSQSVSQVVSDGLYAAVDEYEEAVNGLNCDSTELQVAQSWKKLQSASDKIATYRGLLGHHAARLEDHLAWVENLLRRKQEERALALQAQQAAQQPQVVANAS